VPELVVDRSLILPAVLSANSKYRALLVLLRYGRASFYARSGADEKQLTEELAGSRFGGPSIDDAVAKAEDEKAALEEHLGHPPDQWRMLGSRLLFDSYQHTIRKYQGNWGLDLDPREIGGIRQKLVLTATGFVPDADLVPIIPYTNRRPTDVAIHTGLVGGADILVTEDKRIIGASQTHPESGATMRVLSFDDVSEEISTSSFDLSSIYPQLW